MIKFFIEKLTAGETETSGPKRVLGSRFTSYKDESSFKKKHQHNGHKLTGSRTPRGFLLAIAYGFSGTAGGARFSTKKPRLRMTSSAYMLT